MGNLRTIIEQIRALEPDERQIVELLIDRISQGRIQYGPWNVNDNRNYADEALQEVLDALHYCAAELVRKSRERNAKDNQEGTTEP